MLSFLNAHALFIPVVIRMLFSVATEQLFSRMDLQEVHYVSDVWQLSSHTRTVESHHHPDQGIVVEM